MANHPNRSNLGRWPSPTPEQWRELRHKHKLTQVQAGELICTPPRTIEDWEGGRRRIPAMAWLLLRIRLAEIPYDHVESVSFPEQSGMNQ